jgi:hypothetical protein
MPGDKDDLKFNEQAFLLDFFQKTVRGNVDRVSSKAAGKPIVQSYSNFVQMSGDSAGLMNRLQAAGNPNILWSLTTAQLGMLVPKIVIAKIIHDEKGNLSAQQFHFDDYTSVKAIKQSSRERGSDVGLISFTWNDMGTNPGDSGLSFEAELKLKFQSFDGIFKQRNGISFANLLVPSKGIDMARPRRTLDESEFQIKVIVGWAIPSDPKGAVFKDKKLMAAISHTQMALLLTLISHDVDIKEDGSVDLTIKYIAAQEGRMMTPKMDLFNIYDAEFEKNYELESDELNRLRGEIAKESASAADFKRTMKKQIRILRGGGTVITGGGTHKYVGPGSVGRLQAAYEHKLGGVGGGAEKVKASREEAKEQRELLKNLRYVQKLKQYQKLLGYIENPANNNRRMFFIELNQTQLESYADMCGATFPDVSGVDEAERSVNRRRKIRAHRAEAKKNIFTAGGGNLNVKQANGGNGTQSVLSDIVSKVKVGDTIADTESVFDNFIKNEADNTSALEVAVTEDLYFLNYFYFGDLVEAALQSLKDNPATKVIETDFQLTGGLFGFMLGMINLYDADANGGKGEMVSVPLADIPISLRLFQSWFVESVIKKGVSRMPLLSFLKQVCSKLITGALNPKMFGSPKKAPNTRISMSSMLVRANAFNNITGFRPPTGGRIEAKKIGVKRGGKIKPPPSWATIKVSDMRQFYFLYVGGNLNDGLTGDKSADEEIGIYHLYAGKDTGLIKKINFKRTDIPFQREARIMGAQNNEKAGPPTSNLLFSDHYNASVSMIGNALFKPGMLLFINPTAMGLDPVAKSSANIGGSTSSQIGIGGYYLVTKTENIVENGKFETNLELVAQAPLYALPTVRTSKKVAANDSQYKQLEYASIEQNEDRSKTSKKINPVEKTYLQRWSAWVTPGEN